LRSPTGRAAPLEAAIKDVREKAQAELQRREDKWKPIAGPLRNWLDEARQAQKGAQAIKPLKAAEAWLKDAASDIRNQRFAPSVALKGIQLTGSATKRPIDLKVTVDDVEGAALGLPQSAASLICSAARRQT